LVSDSNENQAANHRARRLQSKSMKWPRHLEIEFGAAVSAVAGVQKSEAIAIKLTAAGAGLFGLDQPGCRAGNDDRPQNSQIKLRRCEIEDVHHGKPDHGENRDR